MLRFAVMPSPSRVFGPKEQTWRDVTDILISQNNKTQSLSVLAVGDVQRGRDQGQRQAASGPDWSRPRVGSMERYYGRTAQRCSARRSLGRRRTLPSPTLPSHRHRMAWRSIRPTPSGSLHASCAGRLVGGTTRRHTRSGSTTCTTRRTRRASSSASSSTPSR